MTFGEEDAEARLSRLAGATAALGPRGGFTARVMAAIEAEQPLGLIDALWASSRRLLPIAALAAAVAVVWAVENQTTVDDALAVTYGSVDLDAE
ncbi:MAG TPA: hypothetical protein VHU80_17325 [Polyangiaceae bacterium]|jgi:hypothetical protein|nr:hypothetical protein [Polyangiaceae bacterium]